VSPSRRYSVSPQGSGVGSPSLLDTTPLPSATQGTPYNYSFTGTGGYGGPYVYLLNSGTLPAGLFWNTSGQISGTPTGTGTVTISVSALDYFGNGSTPKSFSLTVQASSQQAATPLFSPAAGTYTVAQTVTLSCSTPSSTIYYTTNGSTPTTASSVYSTPVTVSATETLKAIATASGYTQSAVGSALYTINAAAPAVAGQVKWNPGFAMLSIGNNTTDLQTAATSPNITLIQEVWHWSSIEPTQGAVAATFNGSNGIGTRFASLIALAPQGIRYQIVIQCNADLGGATFANYSTYDYSNAPTPSYIVKANYSGNAGWLQSTDGLMYTKTLTPSPNPSQYGAWAANWNGSAFVWIVSGCEFHPVIAQCKLNMMQQLLNCVVPTLEISGVTYAGYTVANHPYFETILSWDETAFNIGTSGPIGQPGIDSGVYVNATGAFTGGTPYQSVLYPTQAAGKAGSTVAEIYNYREQCYIGAKQPVGGNIPVGNRAIAVTVPAGYGGATQMQITECLSHLIGVSGGIYSTIAQMRTHMTNLLNGGVGMNSQDQFGNTYSLPYPIPTAQTIDQSAWTPANDPHTYGLVASLIYMGCCWDNENTQNATGPNSTYTYEPYTPTWSGGVVTRAASTKTSQVGFLYRGQMQFLAYIGNGDYSQGGPVGGKNAQGGNVANFTSAIISAIWNSCQYARASHIGFPRQDSNYANISWPSNESPGSGSYIYAGTTNWTTAVPNSNVVNSGSSDGTGPAISSFLDYPAVMSYLPTQLMAGIPCAAVATSTTTANVLWTPLTGSIATGVTYNIYRGGTLIASGQTSGTYADSGLTAGATVNYTVAMVNPNGTGPQGTAFSLVMPVFMYANFSSAPNTINFAQAPSAEYSGSVIVVVGGTGAHEAGAAWYKTQQNITAFTEQFTFQMITTASAPTTQGMTFCVQNSNTTTNPNFEGGSYSGIYAGSDANCCGYGAYVSNWGSGLYGVGNSIGIKFDMNNNSGQSLSYPTGGSPNYTGLYMNGGPPDALIPQQDMNPYGINLYSGHLMSCTIVYDGTLLTMVVTDTVSGAACRQVWPANIPACTAGNSAWVGFTGGTNTSLSPQPQCTVNSWSHAPGYNTRLAAPTFSVASGEYSGTQTVTLSGPAGASIYYTTNGLLPTGASTLYSGSITVSANTIIQAVAIQTGYTDSLVGQAQYQIGTANVINFASGFAANDGVILVGHATLNGSSIEFTDTANNTGGTGGGFETAAAWFGAPVTISGSWTSTFTYKATNSYNSSNGNYGMTFCIQNQTPASTNGSGQQPTALNWCAGSNNAVANAINGLGYAGLAGSPGQNAGIQESVAIALDLSVGSNGGVGLFTGGAQPTGSTAITGVNLASGNPITFAFSYNGTTLSLTITDTVTHGTYSTNWTVNIPSVVGANSAYVGFTAATGYSLAYQYIQNWTMT
jgi:hypothetical protein